MRSISASLMPISSAEAIEIQQIAKEIWPDAYKEIITQEQIDYMLNWMYSEETIQHEIEEEGVFYFWICSNSQKIGFLSIGPGSSTETLHLHKLYLRTKFQGKGYAKEALNLLIKSPCCKQASAIELRVNRDNSRAIAFYTKQGFSITQKDIAEIGNGFQMDDFIMRLKLELGRRA